MNFFYYILLLIYPFLLFLISEEYSYFYTIWGSALIIYYIIHKFVQIIINGKKLHFNIFDKAGMFLLLISFFSVFINGLTNWMYYWIALKYSIALIIASIYYDYYKQNHLKVLLNINIISLIVFIIIIYFRLNKIGFDIKSIIVNREELWFGKPVVFAFMYSAVYYMFVLISYLKKWNKGIKYLLSVPLFLMGARSVFIGIALSLIIFFMNDFFGFRQRTIKITIIIMTILVIISSGLIFESLVINSDAIFLVGSERNLNENLNEDVDLNSFSSGRIDIIKSHIDNFRITHLLQGEGYVRPEIRYSNHNDLLDFFFIFGLIATFIFIRYYIVDILFKLINIKHVNKNLINFSFSLFIFIIIQTFFNPFLSTLTSIYFFIIIILVLKQQKPEMNELVK